MESWGARPLVGHETSPTCTGEFRRPLPGKAGCIRYAAASYQILGAKWERQTARRLAEMRWQLAVPGCVTWLNGDQQATCASVRSVVVLGVGAHVSSFTHRLSLGALRCRSWAGLEVVRAGSGRRA